MAFVKGSPLCPAHTHQNFVSVLSLLADNVHTEEIERYKLAIRGNAEYLASLDADVPNAAR